MTDTIGMLDAYLAHGFALPETERKQILDCTTEVTYSRQEYFIRAGTVCTSIGFIGEGIFRFFTEEDVEERTNDFVFPGSFLTSYVSLLRNTPSDLSIQALTDAVILSIQKEDLYRLYDISPAIERVGRILAEESFINTRTHLLSILHDDAETRYRTLLLRAPHFIQHIPLRYIAAYLGISPETLSRIRRKIIS